jgi:hypothetical protein
VEVPAEAYVQDGRAVRIRGTDEVYRSPAELDRTRGGTDLAGEFRASGDPALFRPSWALKPASERAAGQEQPALLANPVWSGSVRHFRLPSSVRRDDPGSNAIEERRMGTVRRDCTDRTAHRHKRCCGPCRTGTSAITMITRDCTSNRRTCPLPRDYAIST